MRRPRAVSATQPALPYEGPVTEYEGANYEVECDTCPLHRYGLGKIESETMAIKHVGKRPGHFVTHRKGGIDLKVYKREPVTFPDVPPF